MTISINQIRARTIKQKGFKDRKKKVLRVIKKIRQRVLTRSLITFRLLESKVMKYYGGSDNAIDIKYRLKNALRILFRYHINGKRILFVGSTEGMCYEIFTWLKKTKHYIIPSLAWLGGVISNLKENTSFKKMYDKEKNKFNGSEIEKFTRIKNKSHIILAFDEIVDKEIVVEISRQKIPFITFNSALNAHDQSSDYKVRGDFTHPYNVNSKNLLVDLLQSFIKKSKNIKKYCFWLLHKLRTLRLFKKRKWNYKNKKFFKKKKFFNYYKKPSRNKKNR